MSSLPPMDWSEIATTTDLAYLEERIDARFEVLEHRLTGHVDGALRQQTQWVFGAVVLQADTMILALMTLA